MTDRPTYLVDFDGVLCDSRRECMITSHVAYRRMVDGRSEPYAADAIPPAAAELFTRHRYLARIGREFSLLWQLIDAGKPLSEEEWACARARTDAGWLARFHDAFYSARHEWMQNDLPGWLAIHRLFPAMQTAVSRWLAQGRAHIVSSKDSHAILTLMRHHAIDIDAALVHGCEGGDKNEHFRQLRATIGGDLVFIDDCVENLHIARGCGIAGRLASWGYTSEASIASARREGFEILTLANVEHLD